MNTVEFLRDIWVSFNLWNFLRNNVGEHHDYPLMCKRDIHERGRDQIFCFVAHILSWLRTNTTANYCYSGKCRFYLRMTCRESSGGDSEECKRGHWRKEAT